ncbi:hypothetical protein CKF54_00300 [Psittacicella hinzii]|uniref:Toprim domain-containing protein n=1 Tax=Psittacicella hinzii TaxID=2028575 RepID=A0A3A1YB96_9GAMM|nr:hypothetical protein [Psittacicella hinzii]RIY34470.1 hypothetical protein CKF54_00300 [Psittacicella hinzii]
MYTRYFAVKHADKDLFKAEAKKELRHLGYNARVIFCTDNDIKLWAIQSEDIRILTEEFSGLEDYKPYHYNLTDQVDFATAEQWAKKIIEDCGGDLTSCRGFKLSKHTKDWIRIPTRNSKKKSVGYICMLSSNCCTLIVYNYSDQVYRKSVYKGVTNEEGKQLTKQERAYFDTVNRAYYAQERENKKLEQVDFDLDPEEKSEKLTAWFNEYKDNFATRYELVQDYLQLKGLDYDGLVQVCLEDTPPPPNSTARVFRGDLLVPIYSCETSKLMSYQVIKPDGQKRFMKNYGVKNGILKLRNVNVPSRIILCEGYATGASVKLALDLVNDQTTDVAICFSLGNLHSVVEFIGSICSYSKVLALADDDRDSNGNPKRELPELKKCRDKSRQCTVEWLVPPVSDPQKLVLIDRLKLLQFDNNSLEAYVQSKLVKSGALKLKDFNDLYVACLLLGDVELFKSFILSV